MNFSIVLIAANRRGVKEKRTLLDIKDDVHLTPRGGWWITHGLADVGPGVLELDVGYLQATADVPAAERQWKAAAADPAYSGT